MLIILQLKRFIRPLFVRNLQESDIFHMSLLADLARNPFRSEQPARPPRWQGCVVFKDGGER
ncbi:hypothetical protein [Bordetella trematum]|uniref:hypothetical protein n=1 Tax=Bordetella trematum TaxID=123899 RepID=UPI0013FDA2FB|nr:hypothetical protein [Bordetella trematum]